MATVTALALVSVNAAYVSSQVGFVHSARDVTEFDHHIYRSLAQSPPGSPEPQGHRNAPFVWRVATPWLVYGLHRIGLSIDAASYAVTNASLLGFLAFLFLLLRERGFTREEAVLGVVLAGLMQGAVRWYEYQYWMADPLCLGLIAVSFWLIERGRIAWLVPLGILGIAARESYVIVFVYLFCHTLRTNGLRPALGRTMAIACLPLLALVSIRLAIESSGNYTALDTLAWVVEARLGTLFPDQIYWLTVGTFGVVFPLLVLFPDRLARGWRERPEDFAVVAMVYASLMIAISTDRILAYALFVLIPAALSQLRHLRRVTGASFEATAAVCLVLQLFFFSQIQFAGIPATSIRQPVNLWVVASMVGFWFAARGQVRWGSVAG